MKRMRRMIVVLPLLALLVSVATAATPSNVVLDGNPETFPGEWPADSWIMDDGLEDVRPNIPDQYDIRNVYATNSQTTTTPYHFVRYDTQDNLYINIGASTAIYYDTDDITATGELIDCPEGSDFDNLGADFMVYFDMRSGICDIYRYNSISLKNDIWLSSNCDGAPSGAGDQGDTCFEIQALADDLDLDVDEFAVYLLFENRATGGPGDDDLCFSYDIPTSVELSSFTACSEPEPRSEPGLTSLWPVGLVSGVVAVAAGGLVLWRRKGLSL